MNATSGREIRPFLRDVGFYGSEDSYLATTIAIGKILEILPDKNKWCVEFGAWDGIHGSNTRDLILKHSYSGVQIEGSIEKFEALKINYADRPDVLTFNGFVGFDDKAGLDAILKKTPIPKDFDFCVIDIDGNDYHVWNSIVFYRPKVTCIEFNPTIPPEIDFVQPADPSVSQGSSLSALIALGKQKDYELVAVLGVNAFFVDKKYFPLFDLTDNSIHSLWTKRDCLTYFFSGYDGHIFLCGTRKFPWHPHVSLQESKIQVLPTFLQKPHSKRDRLIYTGLTKPAELVKKVIRRVIGKVSG
jgi:hypothetical protein